ncbi:hypothetical protein PR048_032363 [Dryococelus australis]|uniref:Uncharacterized protein n=1 Tax=Dryococelus australis TaxID=614101 RepID=A0ABQ9G212_9NEOP|nr:hypothetical protein PR048_032363 [Dryococelus australis]
MGKLPQANLCLGQQDSNNEIIWFQKQNISSPPANEQFRCRRQLIQRRIRLSAAGVAASRKPVQLAGPQDPFPKPVITDTTAQPMWVKWGEYIAAEECKDVGNWKPPRKPADQQHRSAYYCKDATVFIKIQSANGRTHIKATGTPVSPLYYSALCGRVRFPPGPSGQFHQGALCPSEKTNSRKPERWLQRTLVDVGKSKECFASPWEVKGREPIFPVETGRKPCSGNRKEGTRRPVEEKGSCALLKAVPDKVNTFEVNLEKKSLPHTCIYFNGCTERHAPSKVGNDEWEVVPYLNWPILIRVQSLCVRMEDVPVLRAVRPARVAVMAYTNGGYEKHLISRITTSYDSPDRDPSAEWLCEAPGPDLVSDWSLRAGKRLRIDRTPRFANERSNVFLSSVTPVLLACVSVVRDERYRFAYWLAVVYKKSQPPPGDATLLPSLNIPTHYPASAGETDIVPEQRKVRNVNDLESYNANIKVHVKGLISLKAVHDKTYAIGCFHSGTDISLFLPHFCMSESCLAMPLAGGFSWDPPVSCAHAFRCYSKLLSLHPPLFLRADQISSLTHLLTNHETRANIFTTYADNAIAYSSSFAKEIPGHRIFASGNRAGTMPLVGEFSRGSPISPPPHSGTAPHSLQSSSSALKTSLLRAAQISVSSQAFSDIFFANSSFQFRISEITSLSLRIHQGAGNFYSCSAAACSGLSHLRNYFPIHRYQLDWAHVDQRAVKIYAGRSSDFFSKVDFESVYFIVNSVYLIFNLWDGPMVQAGIREQLGQYRVVSGGSLQWPPYQGVRRRGLKATSAAVLAYLAPARVTVIRLAPLRNYSRAYCSRGYVPSPPPPATPLLIAGKPNVVSFQRYATLRCHNTRNGDAELTVNLETCKIHVIFRRHARLDRLKYSSAGMLGKRGGNRETPRKPADQWHLPARESGGWGATPPCNRTRFASVGGKWSSHYTTVAPREMRVETHQFITTVGENNLRWNTWLSRKFAAQQSSIPVTVDELKSLHWVTHSYEHDEIRLRRDLLGTFEISYWKTTPPSPAYVSTVILTGHAPTNV